VGAGERKGSEGKWGEMTPTLYAHMNKRNLKKKEKKKMKQKKSL
jgi:hypothetical protein